MEVTFSEIIRLSLKAKKKTKTHKFVYKENRTVNSISEGKKTFFD